MLSVKVLDEDEITDDEVGAGSIDLNQFLNSPGPVESKNLNIEEFVSLKYNKKPAGKVLLRVQAIGNHQNQHINQPKPYEQQLFTKQPKGYSMQQPNIQTIKQE